MFICRIVKAKTMFYTMNITGNIWHQCLCRIVQWYRLTFDQRTFYIFQFQAQNSGTNSFGRTLESTMSSKYFLSKIIQIFLSKIIQIFSFNLSKYFWLLHCNIVPVRSTGFEEDFLRVWVGCQCVSTGVRIG